MRIKDASTPPPCINALQRLVFSSGGLGSTVLIMGILALMWLVKGVGDHWSFFHQHQSRCSYLGAVFALQTLLLAPAPLVSPTFDWRPQMIVRAVAGLALALGWLLGYVYPAVPVFGIALCPTAIFMIRILLLASWRVAQ
ncbi:hypothetical protein CN074_13265 [Sinorhizobium medicae]|nr:DUF6064 family protein [Sinorhizobium medicae]MDX0695686.1 hypothetical protein [Sinorhizobium medicae]MDX0745258.1 hypothetical protein [Sinorhizobium medicae]RVH90662.1 hypothetical protein CN201_16035 [Sinorhizobium medicae]RVJ79289.1 hypothetical protein CN168_16895 [Sinorhizobium medicae]RVO70948.1 hypothetical protein CN084_30185 [Sinorhizobium medicae]